MNAIYTEADDEDDEDDSMTIDDSSLVGGPLMPADRLDSEQDPPPNNRCDNNDHGYCHSLTAIPTSLVSEIASFLSVNDVFAMTVTSKTMYHHREHFQPFQSTSAAAAFCLIKEERLATRIDFRSTLEPFRFLFQSKLYGMIQVDFSLVNPLTPEQQRQQPRYHGNPTFQHFYGPSSEETHNLQDIRVQINVQKRFPPDSPAALAGRAYSPKVIFRLDQRLPGCSFHFDSKYVCNEWKAGHLSHLIHVCATRLLKALVADNKNTYAYPPPNKIMRKFTADLRDNVLRCIRNKASKEAEKKKTQPLRTLQ